MFLTVFVKVLKNVHSSHHQMLFKITCTSSDRLRVASLEERIERVWSSETSEDVF